MLKHLPIDQVRELLHQKLNLGRSHREVAASLSVSPGLVAKLLSRAAAEGIDGARLDALPDAELQARLYGRRRPSSDRRPMPDWARVDLELRRPDATLGRLHAAWRAEHRNGFQYTRYCELYRQWRARHRGALLPMHTAGDALYVRHTAWGPWVEEPRTGATVWGVLFLATLAAADFTHAEVLRTREEADWLAGHVRALAALGGVPRSFVHEPPAVGTDEGPWRAYQSLARHYRATVLPVPDNEGPVPGARAERWLKRHLLTARPLPLEALNTRVEELLGAFHARRLPLYGASRAELLERLERPHLQHLPATPFVQARWLHRRVDASLHVEVEGVRYPVAPELRERPVDVRVTDTVVEIFHQGVCATTHPRLDPAR